MFLSLVNSSSLYPALPSKRETRWRSWLSHCATSRNVAGSIPDGVIGNFHWHNPAGRTMALGLTAYKINEYQEYFLVGKGGRFVGLQPYHHHVPIVLKPGSLNLLEPSGPVRACNGIALPFITKQSNIWTYVVQTPISSNPFTIHKKSNHIPWKVRFYTIIRGQQPRQLIQIHNVSETDFVTNLRVLKHLRIPREWWQSHPLKRWYLNYTARLLAPEEFYRILSSRKFQNLK